MVQMVTPSPTPSADGYQHISTPAMHNTSSPWAGPGMSKLSHEQWRFDTPPPEGGIPYGQNPSYYPAPDHQVVSSWHGSEGMDLRSRGFQHRDEKTQSERGDEGEWVPGRRTRAAKRATTKSRRKRKGFEFLDLKVPLSVWAADNNVQPLEVADFAARPAHKRRDDAAKAGGRVKRNLNPFFLYKMAYARVAQAWMAKHHSSLSKSQPPLVTLVGESWRKESEEFKEAYKKLSMEEKQGLKEAFPDYKYQPGSKKAQAKGEQVEERHANDLNPPNTLKRHRSGHFVDPTQDIAYGVYGSGGPSAFDEPAVLPSQEHFYYTSAMPVAHEAGPMITDQATAYLRPGRPGWAHSMNEMAAQSASPAPSHIPYQAGDSIPIDPSLPDVFSDYAPSREVSEEPGFVAPAQLTRHAEPMLRSHSGLSNSGDWMSNPAMSRCASEEPWQGMPDAFLSSLPSNDISDATSAEHYWHLESLEKNDHLQGFAWDAEDWEHDFDDEMAHS